MPHLASLLASHRPLFDGAMGSRLGQLGLSGPCPELLNETHAPSVRGILEEYVQAGAEIVTANSFGTTPRKLARHGLSDRAACLTEASVKVAREAAQGRALVALDMGPTGDVLMPFGPLSAREAYDNFLLVARAGAQAGADLAIIETMGDLLEARLALRAAGDAGLPACVTMSFQTGDVTLMGNPPECAALSLSALGAAMVGMNCSGGPVQMRSPLSRMRAVCNAPILVQPNAGLPRVVGGQTVFPCGPEEMADAMRDLLDLGAHAIGGCCGTTPAHIARMAALDRGAPPAPTAGLVPMLCSGRKWLPVSQASLRMAKAACEDDLYDIPEDASAVLLQLHGHSPAQAAELVQSALSICKQPLVLAAQDADALSAALFVYPGVAGVVGPAALDSVIAENGALRV